MCYECRCEPCVCNEEKTAEDKREEAAEYWMDSERNGD